MMRIALLSVEFPPDIHGGLGRYIEYYTGYLIRNGHHLWVFTVNPGELPVAENDGRLTVFRPVKKLLTHWLQLFSHQCHLSFALRFIKNVCYNIDTYRLIRKTHHSGPLDIIIVHDWMSSWAGIVSAVRLKIPVVFHAHNTEFTMTSWGKRQDPLKFIALSERLLVKIARHIIVPSEKMRRLVVEYGWDSSKISVIPHGYDPGLNQSQDREAAALLCSQIKARLQLGSGDKLLLFAGRLSYAKGIFQLIEAMKIIVAANPNLKLLIVGKGDNQAVDELIRRLGLTEFIHAGYCFESLEMLSAYYELADICVFPSLYEPFGLVAMEAMTFGKPVILGNGFPEMFTGTVESPTALMVESQSPQKIAAAVLVLANDPENAARMGEAARNFVNQHASWDKVFETTVSVYQRVIKNN